MSEAAAEPRTVAVLGSCITRDNFNSRFNPDYKRWYRVGPTTNQSSMIALMSPAVDEPWEAVKPMKPYGLWNVASDLSREILTLLPQERPDVVVLDFFGDVHFGVVRMADGRYLTDNRWRIHKTDLYERLLATPGTERLSWRKDPDAYFELWTDAMDRFAAFMADQLPDTQVVVHCGFNVDAVIPSGETHPETMPTPRRRAARSGTRFWRRLNEHARTAYGWDHIDLSDEHYATLVDHPWGPMEVHYTLDYYPRFLAELDRVTLRRSLDPAVRTTIDALADAAAGEIAATITRREQVAERERALAADRARPRWKRLLRPANVAPLAPLEADGTADRLLAELRTQLDDDTYLRIEALLTTAQTHAAWLRETGPEVSRLGRG